MEPSSQVRQILGQSKESGEEEKLEGWEEREGVRGEGEGRGGREGETEGERVREGWKEGGREGEKEKVGGKR